MTEAPTPTASPSEVAPFAERVLDEIVAALDPTVPLPLPTEWDGPMETADTSAYNSIRPS